MSTGTVIQQRRPKVDRNLKYVLQHRDNERWWIAELTPMAGTDDFGKARKMSGNWLTDTVWDWSLYWMPVVYEIAAAKQQTSLSSDAARQRTLPTGPRRCERKNAQHKGPPKRKAKR